MSEKMQTFAIEVPVGDKKKMEEFQKMMDIVQDETVAYIQTLAKELGVDEGVASDVWYLRTRSRWTQDLEDQIVAAAKAGHPIDSVKICNGEWPENHVNPVEKATF